MLGMEKVTYSRFGEHHERLQSQSRGGLCAPQSVGQRTRRPAGKTHFRDDEIRQRRDCPGGAHPVYPSPAQGLAKAERLRRLYGEGQKVAAHILQIAVSIALTFLLTACGHHKQARVNVPPPPPPIEAPQPAPGTTSVGKPSPSIKKSPSSGSETASNRRGKTLHTEVGL